MSFLLALFEKARGLFVSPHLPLDADYSFEARHREAQRVRIERATVFGIRLVD